MFPPRHVLLLAELLNSSPHLVIAVLRLMDGVNGKREGKNSSMIVNGLGTLSRNLLSTHCSQRPDTNVNLFHMRKSSRSRGGLHAALPVFGRKPMTIFLFRCSGAFSQQMMVSCGRYAGFFSLWIQVEKVGFYLSWVGVAVFQFGFGLWSPQTRTTPTCTRLTQLVARPQHAATIGRLTPTSTTTRTEVNGLDRRVICNMDLYPF